MRKHIVPREVYLMGEVISNEITHAIVNIPVGFVDGRTVFIPMRFDLSQLTKDTLEGIEVRPVQKVVRVYETFELDKPEEVIKHG